MEIKIKDAHRLISSIENEIEFYNGKIRHGGSIHENIYLAEQAFENRCQSVVNNILSLTELMYELRKKVKEFNADKIDEKTAKIAELNAMNNVYSMILGMSTVQHISSWQGKGSGYNEGLSDEFEKTIRSEVKRNTRAIQSLKDSCSGINNQGVITIDDRFENTLKEFALV